MNFDVFNGDADGICALIQLRMAEPLDSVLITGVKRDIDLLSRVTANPGDKVTVLDVSLEKNRPALLALLDKGVNVFYVDHHQAGDIPKDMKLTALIDTDANICTSLLIDNYLNHRFTEWAVTAAFGDNLEDIALSVARRLQISAEQLQQLRTLGICINYNGYGASLEDLYFRPDDLFRALYGYKSPFMFIEDRADIFKQLQAGYAHDMDLAENTKPEYKTDNIAVFILPNEKWARRVSGVWSNELANRFPGRAHAVLTHTKQGDYLVSVRAPLNNKIGADTLCGKFPTGGGRRSAAGINSLSYDMYPKFIEEFSSQYSP